MLQDRSTENFEPIAAISLEPSSLSSTAVFTRTIVPQHNGMQAAKKCELPGQEFKDLAKYGVGKDDDSVTPALNSTTINSRKIVLNQEEEVIKGVILNAQLLTRAPTTKGDNGISDKCKDQELVQNFKVFQTSLKEEDVPKKDQMTLLRKITFGFSFLPSVLFVLCFAIILPCEEPHVTAPCVTEAWTFFLNNTELAVGPEITNEVLVGLYSDKEGRVVSLKSGTGAQLWSSRLRARPRFMDCKDYDANDDGLSDCLIMDHSGWLYAINASDGYTFWNFSTKSSNAMPVLLSDCDGDGVREIAFVDDNGSIQVLFADRKLVSLNVKDCMIIDKQNLTSWVQQNRTGLIFSCKSYTGSGKLKHFPQSSWCLQNTSIEQNETSNELLDSSRDQIEINKALLLSTPAGLVVWAQHLVVFFTDGVAEKWRTHVFNHTQNRFLVYGNFSVGAHVALINADSSRGFTIILLDVSNGNITLTWVSPEAELKNVFSIAGKDHHFLLTFSEVPQRTEFHAGPPYNEIFDSTNATVHRVQNFASFKEWKVMQKIVLFHFERSFPIEVKKKELYTNISDITHETNKDASKITAAVQDDHLIMFLRMTVFNKFETYIGYTYLKKLIAKNWDVPSFDCISAK